MKLGADELYSLTHLLILLPHNHMKQKLLMCGIHF